MTRRAPRRGSARTRGEALGVLLVMLSALGFGTGPILVQGIFDAGVGPAQVLFWRFTIAAVLSWGFVLISTGRRASLRSIPRRRVAVLVLLGALYVGNSGTYVAALQVVPVTLTTILTYTYPAMVAVLATRFLRRLDGRRAWLALGISTLGIALAVGGLPEGGLPPLWGLGLAILSPAIYAGWIVLQARVTGDRPRVDVPMAEAETVLAEAETVQAAPGPAAATALMTLATASTFGLLLLADGGTVSPAGVPTAAWPPLVAFGLLSTALAIQLFYAGIARVGGARAALVSTVEPVFTIALATILLGETLTPVQAAGTALVIGGVLLAEGGGRRDDAPVPSVDPGPSLVSGTQAAASPTVEGPRLDDDPALTRRWTGVD